MGEDSVPRRNQRETERICTCACLQGRFREEMVFLGGFINDEIK